MKKAIAGLFISCLAGLGIAAAPAAAAETVGPYSTPANCSEVQYGDPNSYFWWQSKDSGPDLSNYCHGFSGPGFWYESYGDETGWGSLIKAYGQCQLNWYPPVQNGDVATSIAAGTHTQC